MTYRLYYRLRSGSRRCESDLSRESCDRLVGVLARQFAGDLRSMAVVAMPDRREVWTWERSRGPADIKGLEMALDLEMRVRLAEDPVAVRAFSPLCRDRFERVAADCMERQQARRGALHAPGTVRTETAELPHPAA